MEAFHQDMGLFDYATLAKPTKGDVRQHVLGLTPEHSVFRLWMRCGVMQFTLTEKNRVQVKVNTRPECSGMKIQILTDPSFTVKDGYLNMISNDVPDLVPIFLTVPKTMAIQAAVHFLQYSGLKENYVWWEDITTTG